jgi:MFS family permease
MLLFGVVFLSLGSVNNMLAERFQLDYNAIGTLTALLPFGILAGSLIFGPIVDRFGYKWLLFICALLVGAGLEGMAFANSKELIQFFVFLIGFGGGGLNGATNALAADVSEGERASRLSLLGVFFGIGALGMPFTLAALSKLAPLPKIVAAIGAFAVVPAVWFLVISFPPPKQQRGSLADNFALLKEPVLLLTGLVLAVQSGMEGMSNDWTTRYFKSVTLGGAKGVDVEQKSLYALSALVGAMILTRLCLGSLLKRIPVAAVLFGSLAFSATGALVVMSRGSYAIAVCGMVLIGIGLSACFPLVLGCIGDRFPTKSGTVFSIVFVAALLGNMGINKSLGYIAARYGIEQYTKVMLVCLVASGILLTLVFRQLGKTPKHEHPLAVPWRANS